MKNRILGIINLVLIAACGVCVWYLATAHYSEPPEIAEALRAIKNVESGYNKTTSVDPSHATTSVNLKNILQPLVTATPTPTPTPSPTPAPPDLESATFAWKLQSVNAGSATFLDQRTQETFDLAVGGPAKEVVDKDNRKLQVILISVDLDQFKAVIGYANQTKEKVL